MKVKIEMSQKEKRIALVAAVLISIFIYLYNRRYLYVLDAEFEGNNPVSITLKTGFIFPVKTFIEIKDGFEKKIRMYGYIARVKKSESGYDLFLNNKKVHTIYTDDYYTRTHKLPTGRIYLS